MPVTNLTRWDRVTLPIPYSGQSSHTRFRVRQHDGPAGQWALDDGQYLPLKKSIIGKRVREMDEGFTFEVFVCIELFILKQQVYDISSVLP